MLAQIGNCCTEQLCCVNDAVCCTIILDDTGGTALPIWDDATTFVINGTIMVENNGTVELTNSCSHCKRNSCWRICSCTR